jgi:hypothetical protein
MARQPPLNEEALVKLGSEKLARLVIGEAKRNAVFQKQNSSRTCRRMPSIIGTSASLRRSDPSTRSRTGTGTGKSARRRTGSFVCVRRSPTAGRTLTPSSPWRRAGRTGIATQWRSPSDCATPVVIAKRSNGLLRVACLRVEVQAFQLAHDRFGEAAERPLLEFVVESDESVVIQGMRPPSRRGRRCGQPQTARNTIVANCAIRAT